MDDITAVEAMLRLALAVVPAALIGAEREIGHRSAGLRTHSMVAVGACLFALAGLGLAGSDPARIAAQVASGIGFLGAGAIIRDQFRVTGLTTAASLWVTAAIGVAAGLGAYAAAVITAVAAFIVLLPLKWLEREVFPSRTRQEFSVVFDAGIGPADAVERLRTVLGTVRIRRIEPRMEATVMHGEALEPREPDLVLAAESLRSVPGVSHVDLQTRS